MNQQPDKFFRDKLHDYQKPVSSEAWNRISQNLDEKRRPRLWLKVAAAIAFLATTSILLYPQFNRDNTVASTDRTTSATADQAETATQSAPIADATASEEITSVQEIKKNLPPAEPSIRKKGSKPKKVATAPEEPLQVHEVASTDTQTLEQSNEDQRAIVATSAEESVVEQSRSVTIVFSAQEVNEKYLVKNNDMGATSNDKSSSTLKKLLDKAYDLKHNQDPLGGLRQKKDEILAMNFRNEKQRTQND
jgi:hypothetical protein